jgi:chemotaxis protein methyltransferase CheR
VLELSNEDIDAVCRLVNDLCGIYWDESKSYLIGPRLSSLAKETNCETYSELVRKIRAGLTPQVEEKFVDAVTTNETLWFRDNSPFEALRYKILPELIDDKSGGLFPKRLRIWSAACSTGQEPYSIAIALQETIPCIHEWDIQIAGTDISPSAVEHASRGVYSGMEISRGMDPLKLRRYFTQQGDAWKIRDEIRALCSFMRRNLHQPFADLGTFDIIFCRNVAIYFTEEDRRVLFERAAKSLAPNGWIIVGSSESLSSLGHNWRPQQHCRSNCYRPNMTPAATQVS